jgi:hypothetical protein
MQQDLTYFDGSMYKVPGKIPMCTQEGPGVWHETIEFLRTQPPMPALEWHDGLASAAQDLASDLGPSGDVGHVGSDGSQMWDRVERYGQWQSTIAENFSTVRPLRLVPCSRKHYHLVR